MQRVEPGGFHVECPHCRQELRVHRKYQSCFVECKLCSGQFRLDLSSPRIQLNEELRVGWRYRQARVACKLCGGRIQFVPARDNSSPVS